MTHTGRAGSSVGAGRRHPGWGHPLVALVSLALGVVGVLPFILVGYAVEQLLLAPLGLAPVDPTNDDGTAVLVVGGVVAPLLVLATWAALTAAVVRQRGLGRRSWVVAAAALAVPTLVFVASKLS